MSDTKVCTRCNKEQPLSEYYYNKTKDNYYSRCKTCYKEIHKERYKPKPPREATCLVCGSSFKTKYGYKKKCDDCRWKTIGGNKKMRSPVYFFKCKGCGKLSTAKQKKRTNYCTHECYGKNSKHLKDGVRIAKECPTCGNEYQGTSTQIYCSDICKKRKSKIYIGKCEYCDSAFTSRTKRVTCNDECSYELQKQKMRVDEREFNCDICGSIFKSRNAGRKNCYSCSKKKNNSSSFKRRAKWHNVYYEPVNRYKVYRRDKYICQLCGVKTLKSKAGTSHDREPNIDHIIPMSKGGPHTYNNVQTLCRKCNMDKRDKLVGQQVIVFN